MKLHNPENHAYVWKCLQFSWTIQDIALDTLITDISLGWFKKSGYSTL